jgi:hypothetical protein
MCQLSASGGRESSSGGRESPGGERGTDVPRSPDAARMRTPVRCEHLTGAVLVELSPQTNQAVGCPRVSDGGGGGASSTAGLGSEPLEGVIVPLP